MQASGHIKGPAALPPRQNADTQCTGDSVGPRTSFHFWTKEEFRAAASFPNPYRPARRLVILRVRYPGPVPMK